MEAGAGAAAAPPDLVVLVREGCLSSGLSRRLLDLISALRPQARLEVVDVDRAQALPVTLIATPMWVTGRRLRWLGTPDLEEVLELLDSLRAAPEPLTAAAAPESRTGAQAEVAPQAEVRRQWWWQNWEEAG